MGRVQAAKKNIIFGYLGQIMTALMSFVLQHLFIRYLAKEYLGVNGYYTSVLSILNMAELGIGTALIYSLYGPVARGDKEKIKSYMQMYRKTYRFIGCIVCIVGLILVPFIKYLVKPSIDTLTYTDLTIFYLIFLFNTVSSYFVAYKYSIAIAEQKNYIQNNVITITKIVSVTVQIAVLAVTKNFLLFLIADAVIQLLQKIVVSVYLDRMYPILKEKNIEPLSKEETDEIWTKTKALALHKIGDGARLQTDAMIIGKVLGMGVQGAVSNYNMVINTVSNFANIIFNSAISGFGNLIATDTKEKQYNTFKTYKFLASWIYGFSAVGFLLLMNSFVDLFVQFAGKDPEEWILAPWAVYLIIIDYYFKGERIVLSNYKTAAGVFEQDKYLAIIQGVVNLVLSIWLVNTSLGITGIYVGTVVSGLIANITKPIIIYRTCFDKSVVGYFVDMFKHLLAFGAVLIACWGIKRYVMPEVTLLGFIIMVVIITVVFNGVYLILYERTEEFKYLLGKIKARKA